MHFLNFNSEEEMRDHLDQAHHLGIHPVQHALVGKHKWVQFYPSQPMTIRWGRVLDRVEIISISMDDGAPYEEAVADADAAETAMVNGALYSVRYTIGNPDGFHIVEHKSHVWPVSNDLFEMARAAGWDVSKMDEQGRLGVETAWAEFRAHVLGGA